MDLSGRIEQSIASQLLQQEGMSIPSGEENDFRPAVLCIYEWTTYWLNLPGVDTLRVGSTVAFPSHENWFEVRFENQIGLAKLQPFCKGKSLSAPVFVEVISRKFSSPTVHRLFYSSLLQDLFERLSRLPFTYQSPTGRSVAEALRPSTPLFTYHFLKHASAELRTSLATILAAPHRVLIAEEADIPIEAASGVDPGILLDMVRRADRWQRVEGHPVAQRLGGFMPARILQHLPIETFDTPENRFVLNFLRILHLSTEELFRQPWWTSIPALDKQEILETKSLLQLAILHPTFEDVGQQNLLPLNSQVLFRKDGYRQMLALWQRFQQARRPLYEPLHDAIETRNVAELYEFWAFFALVEQIGSFLEIPPILELIASDEKGLEWLSKAHYGSTGSIAYNRTFRRSNHTFHSYSTTMRPDYTWEINGKPRIIFDAKFSLSSVEVSTAADEFVDTPLTLPALDDLYKMHTYRDALDLRAAVILYPGNTSVFFDQHAGKFTQFLLSELFTGEWSGIGAIPMRPGSNAQS